LTKQFGYQAERMDFLSWTDLLQKGLRPHMVVDPKADLPSCTIHKGKCRHVCTGAAMHSHTCVPACVHRNACACQHLRPVKPHYRVRSHVSEKPLVPEQSPYLGLLSTVATHMCWDGTEVHFFASRTRASASTKPNP
jgi:hypothetical protein